LITTCTKCKQGFEAPEPIEYAGISITMTTCFDCGKNITQERAKKEFEDAIRESSLPPGLVSKAEEHRSTWLVEWKKNFEQIKAGGSLWFSGCKGTGKSVTATQIAMGLLKRRYGVRFVTEPELMRHFGERADSNLFYRDCNAHVVLFDDFGLSPMAHVSVNEFVDSRYRKGLPVIVTDNLGPAALAKRDGYDRAVSRLLDMVQPVGVQFFNGPDRRGK
jgi:DNA replication protein DnaC